jgi:hypothetical protein
VGKQLVRGQCPRGCGETLMVDDSGFVFCSYNKCPQPDAAHQLLGQGKKFLAFIRDDTRLLSINDHESGKVLDNPNSST